MKKHYEDVSLFLSVLEIGAWKVKCRLPANQITSVGTIGPFGEDTSSEEMAGALIDAGFGGVIVERIYKGKDKIMTAIFKVVFNTTTLPQFVRIGYHQYRVSTYVGKPWQCFRCHRFRHNAVNCRAAPRCVVCSGAHNSRECPSSTTRSRCNCSGNHTANYGVCPKIRQVREVEKVRQIEKLSYRDAARQVLHQGGTSLVQPHSERTLNIPTVNQSGDSDSKAKELADHFEKTLGCPPPTPFPQFVLLPLVPALSSSVQSPLNEPLTAGELDRSLASLRNTALGLDRVCNEHLKNLPDIYKRWLLNFCCSSLGTDVIPRQPLTFKQKYKCLGGILDAPHLRWEPQINYLKETSIPILNILQSISHRQWGADCKVLLKLYKTLVRSRLDSAAPLYGAAAPSNLSKLNSIQNKCLCIATGCHKTTPITSLQIEADIRPLGIHREEIACRYYCRLLQLPLNVATSELVQRLNTSQIGSSSLLPTFITCHRGVFGNEAADSAAKAVHLLRYRILTPYSNEETISTTTTTSNVQPAIQPAPEPFLAHTNTELTHDAAAHNPQLAFSTTGTPHASLGVPVEMPTTNLYIMPLLHVI
ncbi:hypothetical protein FHG87_015075 [Trinorchestia longiramus]|nr:hypothetical protein FHG87_015075 [Trinorchestia longiramus]